MQASNEEIVAGALWETPTVTFDTRAYPLVVVRYRGSVTEWDFERHLRVCSSAMRLGPKIALVLDTSDGATRSPRSIGLLREWLQQERATIETRLAGIAFVIPHAAVRFLLSSLLVLDVMYEHEVFDRYPPALEWARDKLSVAA